MRRRSSTAIPNEEADVPMSPLIDCVFLLLIFFLVTTVIKRKEKLIQIEMPDTTAAVQQSMTDDTTVIAISENGDFMIPDGGRDYWGVIHWRKITDLERYLDQLVAKRGERVLTAPLEFSAARELPFQKTLEALDICKNRGFSRVSVRTMKPKK